MIATLIPSRCARLPLAAVLASCLCALPAVAQQLQPVDVPVTGLLPTGPSTSGGISDDGRFVAFASDANNLTLGDPGNADVFLRDLTTSTTTRLTANLPVFYSGVRISGDGNVVGYSRQPAVGQDLLSQAFAFDRTTLATVAVAPTLFEVVIQDFSHDGRFAVVTARLANTTNSPVQVMRVDLTDGSMILCSHDVNGNPVNHGNVAYAMHPRIDGDGTHVAFASLASTLVVGDSNNVLDVFVLDIPGDVMLRASLASDGSQGTASSIAPTISADGRFVAFETHSAFALGDTNNRADVYLRDLRLETTTRVSLDTFQQQSLQSSYEAEVSPDGRQVAYSIDVVGGPTGVHIELRVRDLESGFTLSPQVPGPVPPFRMQATDMSADGRRVLVDRRDGGPGVPHVQVLDFGPPCTIAGYCSANVNSSGNAASLGAQGSASRELNNLVLAVVGMPDTAVALLYSGTSAIDPGTPFGDGLKCVGGTIVRHSIQQAVLGTIIDAQDVHSLEYANVHPGDTRYYQVLYRDPAAGGAGFNTTDAVAVTFCW